MGLITQRMRYCTDTEELMGSLGVNLASGNLVSFKFPFSIIYGTWL